MIPKTRGVLRLFTPADLSAQNFESAKRAVFVTCAGVLFSPGFDVGQVLVGQNGKWLIRPVAHDRLLAFCLSFHPSKFTARNALVFIDRYSRVPFTVAHLKPLEA